jgi:hypothetical protein
MNYLQFSTLLGYLCIFSPSLTQFMSYYYPMAETDDETLLDILQKQSRSYPSDINVQQDFNKAELRGT